MDRKTRERYPQFTYDWVNLGYSDFPQMPNLTNNIHPIFKATKFDGSRAEYEMIEPAIRLASNYLNSANSSIFVHSLVYGERKPVPSRCNIGGQTFRANGKVVKVGGGACTDVKRTEKFSIDKINHIWRQIALHSRFGPKSKAGCNGYCAHIDKDGADVRGNGCHGQATFIAFHRKFLVDIYALLASGKEHSLEMLNVQFSLAVILCHEVGHAIGFASNSEYRRDMLSARITKVQSPTYVEPFYDGQHTAELGYAFVNEILDCNFTQYVDAHPETFCQLSDWPNGWYHHSFAPYVMPNRDAPAKARDYEVFILDMRYVQRVFRQDFWDSLAKLPEPEDQGRALKIPKTVGFWDCAQADFETWSHEEQAAMWKKAHRKLVRTPTSRYELEVQTSWEYEQPTVFVGDDEKAHSPTIRSQNRRRASISVH